MSILEDDLGHRVRVERPPRRIVSLVPSLTETLATSVPDRLVGATEWCTHPTDLDVPRVRGTKNPDLAAIAGLHADLVVANREENRKIDVARLREAGIPVWVTVIETVDEALRSIRRLLSDLLAVSEPAWIASASIEWSRPVTLSDTRVVVPVWRDPWMVVGSRTFTGDVLARLGLVNAFADSPDRYPKKSLDQLHGAHPELVVLPDEPYAFAADDGPEAFPGTPAALVSGRSLTWYGPSMAGARDELAYQIRLALGDGPSLRR